MNIFQIPKKDFSSSDMIIGIIDASGSMTEYWKWVAQEWNSYVRNQKAITIVFDTLAEIVDSNILNDKIDYHGGGGTSLAKAFQLFESEVSKMPKNQCINVLFISDGLDNNKILCQKRLLQLQGIQQQKINFLCLGIGQDFPTFISLDLRKKYHNGDDNIPAIFLIEFPSELAFKNKFTILKDFLIINKQRKIDPPVCVYPWKEYQSEVFEKQWIMTHEKSVQIDGEQIEVNNHQNLEGFQQLLQNWHQMIHLESLNETNQAEQIALKTISVINDMLELYEQETNLNLLSILREEDSNKQESFGERATKNSIKKNYKNLLWFYDDIMRISKGKQIKQENQFDAAKRMGIGTIVSKAQQKQLYDQNFSKEKYEMFKQEFQQLYIKHQSEILQSENVNELIKIFKQSDFLEGLNLCVNQYELISSFPLFGYACKIRKDQNENNPWNIEIEGIYENEINLTDIVQNHGGISIQTIEGIKSITGVLPIFSTSEKWIQKILTSNLMNVLMSQNVIQNISIDIKKCYLALISESLIYLMKIPSLNEFQKQLLHKILLTGKMIINEYDEYNKLISKCIDGSILKSQIKEPKMIKMAFLVINLVDKDLIDFQTKQKLGRFLAFHLIQQQNIKLDKLVKVEYISKSLNFNFLTEMTPYFNQCFTSGDLKRKFITLYKQCKSNLQIQLDYNVEQVLKNSKIKSIYSYQLVQNFITEIGSCPLQKEDYNNILKYTHSGLSSENYFTSNEEDINKMIQIGSDNIHSYFLNIYIDSKGSKRYVQCEKQFIKLYEQIYQQFRNYFKANHKLMIPNINDLSEDMIEEISRTGKLSNFCMSPLCPFYLKKSNRRLSHHLSIWTSQLPKGFHSIVFQNRENSIEEIYRIFMEKNDPFDFVKFDVKKEFIIYYIERLVAFYRNILIN